MGIKRRKKNGETLTKHTYTNIKKYIRLCNTASGEFFFVMFPFFFFILSR